MPAPFGPMIAVALPRGTSASTDSRMRTPPMATDTFSKEIADDVITLGVAVPPPNTRCLVSTHCRLSTTMITT